MPALYLKDTNRLLAQLDDADLAHMVAVMEEESSTDQDYFIDLATLNLLKAAGLSAALVTVLESAIADSDGVDVIWR
jgi:inactivated superfamily I helicase